MYRLLVLVILLSQWALIQPQAAIAQSRADAEAAATVAVELSALEASGDFNTLYDRIHPDAHAEIPRAAVLGWFQNEFAPRGPGVSTVTGVNFVSWTWAVTGQTYPYTAEVSFLQPFADGTVVEDVVRLVQDHKGEWRWFFGRSREFVNEQIAKYVPAAPIATQPLSKLDTVISDIDTYWSISFAAGQSYTTPDVVDISNGGFSQCGFLDPNLSPGYYCSLDETIYISILSVRFYEADIGDFAWITILAHEWGHHIQALTGAYTGPGNAMELQADCLAGSYARNAATLGYLEHGDLFEAITISARGGDPIWLPQDQEGAHGTGEDRVIAFMRGYLDGFIGCDFMTGNASAVVSQPSQSEPANRRSTATSNLMDLLPPARAIPHDLQLTAQYERSLAEVVVNYTNPTATEALFTEWDWSGNIVQNYEGTGWSTGVTWVYISVHEFDRRADASRALSHSLEDQMNSTGAWEISVSALGDSSRALGTTNDVTIYVLDGNVVFRITVATTGVNPLPIAEDIAEAMLE